ncbi:hypothetical protein MRX96_057681 [Rhipicephalus microplus]
MSSYQRKRADEVSCADIVIVDLLHEVDVMALKAPENLFHHRRKTVATYGRLLDRFDSGRTVESLLVGNNKFPELSAAFDTGSAEYICCTECVSRSLLEISSVATGAPVPCSRCKDVRAMRKSYAVLHARVISYFFWPAVLDSMNVAETVELPAEPGRKRAKIYRRKAKLKKPWVKAKWMQRKQAAAEAAAAAGATAQQVNAPGEDGSARPSRT